MSGGYAVCKFVDFAVRELFMNEAIMASSLN